MHVILNRCQMALVLQIFMHLHVSLPISLVIPLTQRQLFLSSSDLADPLIMRCRHSRSIPTHDCRHN